MILQAPAHLSSSSYKNPLNIVNGFATVVHLTNIVQMGREVKIAWIVANVADII